MRASGRGHGPECGHARDRAAPLEPAAGQGVELQAVPLDDPRPCQRVGLLVDEVAAPIDLAAIGPAQGHKQALHGVLVDFRVVAGGPLPCVTDQLIAMPRGQDQHVLGGVIDDVGEQGRQVHLPQLPARGQVKTPHAALVGIRWHAAFRGGDPLHHPPGQQVDRVQPSAAHGKAMVHESTRGIDLPSHCARPRIQAHEMPHPLAVFGIVAAVAVPAGAGPPQILGGEQAGHHHLVIDPQVAPAQVAKLGRDRPGGPLRAGE